MTSPSRRNRRTTRPSIRRLKSVSLSALIVAFCCTVVDAAEQTPGRRPSLLERFQERNPLARWRARSDGWRRRNVVAVPEPAAAAPAAPSFAEDKAQSQVIFPVVPPLSEAPGNGPPRVALQPNTVPKATPAADVDRLRKIGEILPYHDYAPETLSRRVASKKLPEEKWEKTSYAPRVFPDTVFTWQASNLWHYPLYFEHPALERYGHTYPSIVQPFDSARRMMWQLAGLPYQATIDPICKKVYTLGWYRPGECAPYLHYMIPLNGQAALVQAGVMTGMFFLIP